MLAQIFRAATASRMASISASIACTDRQQRLGDEPLLVRQFIPPPRHTPSVSEGRLNHAKGDNFNQIHEFAP